ncbi:MAG TPA: M24 family metallopeptidase [Noviherbaspirillum sp.]
MQERSKEIQEKLAAMRGWLRQSGAAMLRLRGTDWFAWATAGGSNTVLLAAETGVAEIAVTPEHAYVLTDEIEAQRLQDEEVPAGCYEWHVAPWADSQVRRAFCAELAAGGRVLSDRPAAGEQALDQDMLRQRYCLVDSEIARYREVGLLAAQAMTEVMQAARPDWTEFALAGAGAEAMWARGLHPTLTLVANERRLPIYRHATPTREKLGRRAMLVFCARGYGLYANLTRFVHFAGAPAQPDFPALMEIEAAGLAACRPGVPLSDVYATLEQAYCKHGFSDGIRRHHQGGICGYLSRELVATPATDAPLAAKMAVAFNPSLPGIKLEDTFLIHDDGLENLTMDPDWPTVEHAGRQRALPLETEAS